MLLEKGSLSRVEKRLARPFTLLHIAQVDELAVYAYTCLGAVAWHRHLDYDELFMVYRGLMMLETQWGSLIMGPWDVAVTPKSLGHRSSSTRPCTVLLIQASVYTGRRNGDRRLFVEPDGKIGRISLSAEARKLPGAFAPVPLLRVDESNLSLVLCEGLGKPRSTTGQEWLLVHSGRAVLEAGGEALTLGSGEFAVVPRGMEYTLSGQDSAVMVRLGRG